MDQAYGEEDEYGPEKSEYEQEMEAVEEIFGNEGHVTRELDPLKEPDLNDTSYI